MGMTGKDRFRNFAVKRLEFAGFTSCENFRCYCGPILRGVRGMEKKSGLPSISGLFFPRFLLLFPFFYYKNNLEFEFGKFYKYLI